MKRKLTTPTGMSLNDIAIEIMKSDPTISFENAQKKAGEYLEAKTTLRTGHKGKVKKAILDASLSAIFGTHIGGKLSGLKVFQNKKQVKEAAGIVSDFERGMGNKDKRDSGSKEEINSLKKVIEGEFKKVNNNIQEVSDKTDESASDIKEIKKRLSVKDITIGKDKEAQTYKFDPLAPEGKQVREAGGGARFATKAGGATSAYSQVLNKAAMLGTQKPEELTESKEQTATRIPNGNVQKEILTEIKKIKEDLSKIEKHEEETKKAAQIGGVDDAQQEAKEAKKEEDEEDWRKEVNKKLDMILKDLDASKPGIFGTILKGIEDIGLGILEFKGLRGVLAFLARKFGIRGIARVAGAAAAGAAATGVGAAGAKAAEGVVRGVGVAEGVAKKKVGGLTGEGLAKYKELRTGGMSPAAAKAEASKVGGFSAHAEKEAQTIATKTKNPKINKLTKEAAEEAAKKETTKVIEKTAEKGIGKSLLKKVPLIGLGAGILFGIQRAVEGDYTGAALEIASGAASMIPGWGTAASIALDVGIAARDIKAAEVPEGSTDQPVSEGTAAADKIITKPVERVSQAAATGAAGGVAATSKGAVGSDGKFAGAGASGSFTTPAAPEGSDAASSTVSKGAEDTGGNARGVKPDVLSKKAQLEKAVGKSLIITSGYRPGDANHGTGDAIDLGLNSNQLNESERNKIFSTAIGLGFTGLGAEYSAPGGAHIHLDTSHKSLTGWGSDYHSSSLSKDSPYLASLIASKTGKSAPGAAAPTAATTSESVATSAPAAATTSEPVAAPTKSQQLGQKLSDAGSPPSQNPPTLDNSDLHDKLDSINAGMIASSQAIMSKTAQMAKATVAASAGSENPPEIVLKLRNDEPSIFAYTNSIFDHPVTSVGFTGYNKVV